MSFKYRIIWVNINKGKQEWCDVDNQHIAVFIAKKKLSDGMQNVIIQVTSDNSVMSDPNDASWPAIDIETTELNNEII